MKKWLALLLTLALSLAAIPSLAAQETGFAIPYPSYMTESEGEALALPQKPERIVCLSNAALQALVRSDIRPIAVTTPTSFVEYPDWVAELPVIATGMGSLDVESVIALEPDLVIMGVHLKEGFAQQLTDANIPVYYTSEGPSITYAETKEEALTLVGAFGSESLAQALEAEFAEVEQRAAEYAASHETRRMMILFAAPPS
ncbi:MAG TPA: ABC transporter substrate-binding protein, partial [Clostridia bacterium]|nr:ABC transporter substrate-binding protein [Clostridia bacterium]